jgi:methionine sulfoxide reductase heme-binding subunit
MASSVAAARPGDLRRRLLRHYLPIAAASAMVFALFLGVPYFNANRYGHASAIFTEGISGAWPVGDGGPIDRRSMEHGQDTSGSGTQRGNDSPGAGAEHGSDSPGAGAEHGNDSPGAGAEHGNDSPGPRMPHGGSADAGTQHGGDGQQPSPTPAEVTPSPGDSTQHGPSGRAAAAQQWRRLTVASGYIAVVLLALTLLTGPANLVLRRRTPVSMYFRRDVGLAATAMSLAHVVFGFLVGHADGILGYFLEAGDRTKILTNAFGLANWAGLAATLIVVGLAAISSDAALRRLKAKRWKRLQRLNYLLFGLVIVHAVLYGALWRKTSPYTWLLVVSTVMVLAGQAIGVRLWRRRRAKAALAAT